jgi:hypothetical protein
MFYIVYGINAIEKAAYKFGGHFYFLIDRRDRMTEVWLIPKDCSKFKDRQLPAMIATPFQSSNFRQQILPCRLMLCSYIGIYY